MRLAEAQLFVDGALAAQRQNAGSGPVVWVHLPREGRYLAALDPQGNPRFTQAGRVIGNTMEFTSDGNAFRIVCKEPIVPGPLRLSPTTLRRQSATHPEEILLGNAGPAALHVQ